MHEEDTTTAPLNDLSSVPGCFFRKKLPDKDSFRITTLVFSFTQETLDCHSTVGYLISGCQIIGN